jgi:hypothetical protein
MDRFCSSIGSAATSSLPKLYALDAFAHDASGAAVAVGDDEKSAK